MTDLVIRKSDIEIIGRKLMKEVYKFLHDDYMLTFDEMKVEQKKLKEYLVNYYLSKIYEEKCERFIKKMENKSIYDKNLKDIVDEIEYDRYLKEKENKSKHDKYLKEIVAKIEDESLDINIIFDVLNMIDLDFEIDEDLFNKRKAFKYFYSVYYYYHKFYDYYLKK